MDDADHGHDYDDDHGVFGYADAVGHDDADSTQTMLLMVMFTMIKRLMLNPRTTSASMVG